VHEIFGVTSDDQNTFFLRFFSGFLFTGSSSLLEELEDELEELLLPLEEDLSFFVSPSLALSSGGSNRD